MANPEAVRVPNAQTRNKRVYETRRLNYEEAAPLYRVVAQDKYAAIDMVGAAAATWGEPILVDAYERLHMFLRHTAGTVTTAVHVKAQCALWNQDDANLAASEVEWYDLYEDPGLSGGVIDPLVYDFAWTTGTGLIAFKVPRYGRFMRFKVWVDGSDKAGSRAALYASRVMEAA